MSDLWRFSAVELSARIRRRDVSALQAAQCALDSLHAVNPLINPVVDKPPEDWFAEGSHVDHAQGRG
ncbi:amidase, partial [Achromobacter xylosoxidans]